jgi:signal transduction histidine kinase
MTHDEALLRRVRLRLLAWSGGTTLVVLLTLGALIYALAATSLAASAEDQLRTRAADMRAGIQFATRLPVGPIGSGIVDVASAPGIVIGGPTSGTIAVIWGPNADEAPIAPPIALGGVALPAGDALAEARNGVESVTTLTLEGTPVRLLSTPVDRPEGTYVIQVVGDRTTELRTLTTLLAVLLVGGLAVLAASLAVGWLYADRALVPIREAMRRQREFAADASHELRTPLAVVRGSVEDLRRNATLPVAEVGHALEDIETEVDRMRAMVDDLLLLARTDSGVVELTMGPVDLAAVALDAADGLLPSAERRGVRIEVDAEPIPTTGDAARLRQLVTILVDNALRHAPTGSTVGVSVHALDGSGSGSGSIRVTDHGPGFLPGDLPHVFDRFWRASDAPPGGTGLGLSIAAWIAERHGGSVTASNAPAGGAVLEVRLPLR